MNTNFQLYTKSLNEEETIALKIAQETFGKNFRLEETTGFKCWLEERTFLLAEYNKAIANLDYALEHQYNGWGDDDMSEERILADNDNEGVGANIKYFSNANIERVTEIVQELLEDESLWSDTQKEQ